MHYCILYHKHYFFSMIASAKDSQGSYERVAPEEKAEAAAPADGNIPVTAALMEDDVEHQLSAPTPVVVSFGILREPYQLTRARVQ
jgi:hypothetical protein